MTESRRLPLSKNVITALTIITAIVAIDQITKQLARVYLKPIYSKSLIGDFLRLTYVENPGMAFGIEIENRLLFNLLSIVAVGIIVWYMYQLRSNSIFRFAFAMILGGAAGNLIDRFLFGRVVDFVDVEFFDIHIPAFSVFGTDFSQFSLYRWPVFNVADMAVTISMVILIACTFIDFSPRSSTEDGTT